MGRHANVVGLVNLPADHLHRAERLPPGTGVAAGQQRPEKGQPQLVRVRGELLGIRITTIWVNHCGEMSPLIVCIGGNGPPGNPIVKNLIARIIR